MSALRIFIATTLVMLAFAGNSLLTRAALTHSVIDPASYTSIRLMAGALILALVGWWSLKQTRALAAAAGKNIDASTPSVHLGGSWRSALALFLYAACLSFSYGSLTTAMGALILFGAVQVTMIGYGLWRGERFRLPQGLGFLLAIAGLIGLMLPGIATPPLLGALVMMASGVAWGVYSLRGRGERNATQATAGNFIRAVPMTLILSLLWMPHFAIDALGFWLASASGALTSGLGYALWYAVLPALKATQAAVIQLSVPVLAAIAGVVFLGEAITLRLFIGSLAILGGIALVTLRNKP